MNNNAWKRVREQNKVTLHADNKPYQVIDLKDIDDMSEEEYNDKLKDAWFKKSHYETVEELTMAKYYNYEVEEERPKEKTDWTSVIFGVAYWGILFGILIFAIVKVVNGG